MKHEHINIDFPILHGLFSFVVTRVKIDNQRTMLKYSVLLFICLGRYIYNLRICSNSLCFSFSPFLLRMNRNVRKRTF